MKIVDHSEREIEIEKNLRAFQSKLPALLKSDNGRFALLRDEEIVGVFDTMRDAKFVGDRFLEDGRYSIQEITDIPVDLGFFST